MTLITCTPYAVNTLWILVRGFWISVENAKEIQKTEQKATGITNPTGPMLALCVGVGIVIAVILVAAGGIRVVGQKNAAENQTPQVPVVTAGTGDVEEIVDASGTVGSEEEKTYYSPVNAELKTVSFSQGDVVKKGTKLIEFETENLEKDNQRAELNLKSTRSDIKDTVNKSVIADKSPIDATAEVGALVKIVKD